MDVLPLSFFSAKITKTAWSQRTPAVHTMQYKVHQLAGSSGKAVASGQDQYRTPPTSSTLSSWVKMPENCRRSYFLVLQWFQLGNLHPSCTSTILKLHAMSFAIIVYLRYRLKSGPLAIHEPWYKQTNRQLLKSTNTFFIEPPLILEAQDICWRKTKHLLTLIFFEPFSGSNSSLSWPALMNVV